MSPGSAHDLAAPRPYPSRAEPNPANPACQNAGIDVRSPITQPARNTPGAQRPTTELEERESVLPTERSRTLRRDIAGAGQIGHITRAPSSSPISNTSTRAAEKTSLFLRYDRQQQE
ncbi:hypothetical protein GCM10022222_26780 [Amycolatopsis ultiminotia]|uniref:Uncharacterized protein n=1 Tax=Amycolatopsis ultiminotia TaxID=543629 RepID=A0ABP6VX06_9PSEU